MHNAILSEMASFYDEEDKRLEVSPDHVVYVRLAVAN